MKKLLAIVLAMIMLVSFAACGSVKEIVLSESNIELKLKGTHSISCTVLPEEAAEEIVVEWSSSDESIATVDSDGKITAVGAGTCTITATADKKSADVTVTVDSLPEEYIILGSEVIALEDFAEEIEDNELKFENKYQGKEVTVVARIKRIQDGYYQTNLKHSFTAMITLNGGSFMNSIVVEAGSEATASQFDIDELVKVEGKFSNNLYGTSFYMYGPNTITKVSD